VKELFFTTPARRKFLKSTATELAHCQESVRRHALARPDVGFEIWHDGKLVGQWRAHKHEHAIDARLSDVLGAQLAKTPTEQHDALLKDWGIWLDNTLQMTGLMVGGILWGVLGDRLGRLTVLFGSILTYSIANLLNACVADVDAAGALGFLHAIGLGTAIRQYEVLRFLAGIGLAGELGAGITLVAELTSRERRGIATTIVASVGILGAVVAYFVTQLMSWRAAFAVGATTGMTAFVAGGATSSSTSPRDFSSSTSSVWNLVVAVSLAPSPVAKGTITTRGFCAWALRLPTATATHIN
jgi:MFS family permease